MKAWYLGNLNQEENKREQKGIYYYIRGVQKIEGQSFERYAIQTHFIEQNENYLQLIRHYVLPIYQEGDLLCLSEKVIAMCQNHTIEKSSIHVGFWAKWLSRFALKCPNGIGMSEPYKLQLAINLKGLPLILWAAFCSGIGKLFGKRGIFYQIAGSDVAGIDGFYEHSAIEKYHHLAVLTPINPNEVCEKIYQFFGIRTFLADANDINVEILGKCSGLKSISCETLCLLIEDNPAGQDDELTPFVLIRNLKGKAAEPFKPMPVLSSPVL